MKLLRTAIAGLALLVLALVPMPSVAQTLVVTTCGAVASPYVAGQTGRPMLIDINGNLCTSDTAYPAGATPLTGIGAGSTSAVVGTLTATATTTAFICGFDVSAIGGTAAVGPVVIAGLTGGSFTYQLSSLAAGTTLSRTFTPCIPASAVNTNITITTTADGSATAVDVNSWGYRK